MEKPPFLHHYDGSYLAISDSLMHNILNIHYNIFHDVWLYVNKTKLGTSEMAEGKSGWQ